MITAAKILQFFEDELGIDSSQIGTDTPLFSSGILDSFSLVNLMLFLENEGDFRIRSMDVSLENFDSVNRIVAYADRSAHAALKAS